MVHCVYMKALSTFSGVRIVFWICRRDRIFSCFAVITKWRLNLFLFFYTVSVLPIRYAMQRASYRKGRITIITFNVIAVAWGLRHLLARPVTVSVRQEPVCVAMTAAVNKLTTVAQRRFVVVTYQWVGAFTSISNQLTDLCPHQQQVFILYFYFVQMSISKLSMGRNEMCSTSDINRVYKQSL